VKTKKWEGTDTVVVSGTFVKLNYLCILYLCRYQCATVGNRYLWQGEQTEKKFGTLHRILSNKRLPTVT